MSNGKKVGIELEFGTRPFMHDGIIRRQLFPDTRFYGQGHCENGFRIYTDEGGHLEISTALATDPWQATAAYFGAQIIAKSIHGTKISDPKLGEGTLELESLLRDFVGHSWGMHECYENSPRIDDKGEDIYRILGSALVAGLIYSAGWPEDAQSGSTKMRVARSQRGRFARKLSDVQTTKNRPIVNTREYPGRHHFILNDANMLDFAVYARVNRMYDFLTLLERGYDLTSLILDNTVDQMITVANDEPDADTLLKRADGKTIKLSELNQEIDTTILDILGDELPERRRLMHEQSLAAGEEFESFAANGEITSEFVEDGQLHPLHNKVDAISKKHHVLRLEGKGKSPDAMRNFNRLWHTMGSDNVVDRMRGIGALPDMFGIMQQAQAIVDGTPPSIHAERMSRFFDAFHGKPNVQIHNIDWDHGRVGGSGITDAELSQVVYGHPYRPLSDNFGVRKTHSALATVFF